MNPVDALYAMLRPGQVVNRIRENHHTITNQKQAIVEMERYRRLSDKFSGKQSETDTLAKDYEGFFR